MVQVFPFEKSLILSFGSIDETGYLLYSYLRLRNLNFSEKVYFFQKKEKLHLIFLQI